MDFRVRWTEPAWRQLEAAADFIALDSPRYAAILVNQARTAARTLKDFPRRGRVVPEERNEYIRELFVQSHRLIYRIVDNEVQILAFVHFARDGYRPEPE
jgi:toxin ParE1/3/4